MFRKNKNVKEIIKLLKKQYPNPDTELRWKTPFELLTSVILSAQCTDKRVNEVTKTLFKKYTNIKSFAKVKQEELEKDIFSTGFYRNKAKNIIASANKIIDEFNGDVPSTMEELLSLPGVARKTANVVLGTLFNKAEGIVVDTHVKRLSYRLGLTKETNPDKVETDLVKIIDKKDWIFVSHALVLHGRYVCRARKPNCEECVLAALCPKNAVIS